MATISITFHESSGRFHIACPVFANDRPRSLPNKRWNARLKLWVAPAIRVNIMALRTWRTDRSIQFDERSIEVLNTSLDAESPRKDNVPFPAWYKFKRQPRQAQARAFERMYGMKNIALFMDMRTGKTKVFIDMACALRMEGKIDNILLICPINLRRNWIAELEKDATIPFDVYMLDTKDKGKRFAEWIQEPHDFKIMMVGIESLGSGSAHTYCQRFLNISARAMIGIDESQSIKTHDSNRAIKCHEFRDYAKFRVIMTGTSMSKSSMDLYSQFEFLDPDIVGCGDFHSFRNRYAVMGGYENKQVIGYTNQDELMDLIAPYIYQVAQADAIDVPPKTYEIRTVTMTPEQEKLYKEFRGNKSLTTLQGSLAVEMAMQVIQRSHEIAGGFYTTEIPKEELEEMKEQGVKVPRFTSHRIEGRNAKIDECVKIAREMEGSIIYWCAYVAEVEALARTLRSIFGQDQVAEIHGGVPEKERFEHVKRFQSGEARFLVGNATTGGVGLTLSRAETMVYYSCNFALLDRQQSIERATGETPVLVIDLLAEKTVDFLIRAALEEKRDVTAYVREQINNRVPFNKIMGIGYD